MSAISDSRRLKILKSLEQGPAYQSGLSEETGVKGGTFKHHMEALMNTRLVHQEATRGRYLITQLGVEALKLAEIIYKRYKFEVKSESGDPKVDDLHEDETTPSHEMDRRGDNVTHPDDLESPTIDHAMDKLAAEEGELEEEEEQSDIGDKI